MSSERLAPEPPLLALANGKYLNVDVGSPPSPNAPTAVFVHGLGGVSSNHYALIQASELESTHKVITFDLEGAGKSPLSRPAATLTIQSFAEDIRFLLQALKILSPVTLIGHSMGGVSRFNKCVPTSMTKSVALTIAHRVPLCGSIS